MSEPLSSTSVEDIVAFFSSLPKAKRLEYEALAELDRTFGEDVEAESGTRGGKTSEDMS